MYSPEPVLHEVTAESGWPLPVASIANALELPLPSYLQNTADLSHLLEENPNSPSTDPLLLALPFVLTAARQLGAIIQMNHLNQLYVRPTTPIWFTLVQTLGYICSKDLAMISETPYFLPRTGPLASEDLNLDGWATALVSLIVDNVEDNECDTMASDTISHFNSASESAAAKFTDMPSANTDSSRASQRSLDVPFDAHMLPSRGPRLCAVLPIICVADESNIHSLLTSTLYQRYVWTIKEPVVGLVIPRAGAIAQVYLAWLEVCSDKNDQLPTPHIASANGSDLDESLGLFDLEDPISGLLFAQFVAVIGHQVQRIKEASNPPRISPLSWRSDDPINIHPTLKDEPSTDQISSWAHKVATASMPV